MLLTVAYDGSSFAGFAPQPDQRTIAGELLAAIRAVDGRIDVLRGASRTDAGVHALGQRVAFDTVANLPPRAWVLAVTKHLPSAIAVRRAAFVEPGFAPRFANRGKRYRYLILRDRARDPFYESRAWRLDDLDDDAIGRAREEVKHAIGEHDFSAFRSSSDPRPSSVRTIREVVVRNDPADARLVAIEVEGNAFLHNMVRILVGTVVDVARGRIAPGAIDRALASRDRRDGGITAPPDGLYLDRVLLDDEGAEAWP